MEHPTAVSELRAYLNKVAEAVKAANMKKFEQQLDAEARQGGRMTENDLKAEKAPQKIAALTEQPTKNGDIASQTGSLHIITTTEHVATEEAEARKQEELQSSNGLGSKNSWKNRATWNILECQNNDEFNFGPDRSTEAQKEAHRMLLRVPEKNTETREDLRTLEEEHEKTSNITGTRSIWNIRECLDNDEFHFTPDHKKNAEKETDQLVLRLQKENTELRENLLKLEKKHEKTLAKLDQANVVVSRDENLERKLLGLARGVLNLKMSTEENFEKLSGKMENFGAQETEKDREIETLKSQFWKIHVEKEALVDQNSELSSKVDKLKDLMAEQKYELEMENAVEVERLEKELEEQHTRIATELKKVFDEEMKSELEKKDLKIKELEQKLVDQNYQQGSRHETKDQMIERLQLTQFNQRVEIVAGNHKIKDLEQALVDQKTQMEAAKEAELQELQTELYDLKSWIQSAYESLDIEKLQTELAEKEAKLQETETWMSADQEKIQELRQELVDQKAGMEKELNDIKSLHLAAADTVHNLKAQVASMSQGIVEQTNIVSAYQAANLEFKVADDEKTKMIKVLKEELRLLETKFQDYKGNIEAPPTNRRFYDAREFRNSNEEEELNKHLENMDVMLEDLQKLQRSLQSDFF